MAAKALMKAGEKIGWDVKMEQQSAMGTINRVTREEALAARLRSHRLGSEDQGDGAL